MQWRARREKGTRRSALVNGRGSIRRWTKGRERGRGGPYSCHDDIWAIRPLIVSPWIKLKLGDQPSKATVNIAADTRPVPRFIIGRRNRPRDREPRENFLNRGRAVLSRLSLDFLSSLLHVIFRIYDGLWFGGKWFKLLLVLSIQRD